MSLKFYRLQKISEGAIDPQTGEDAPRVSGPTAVGTGNSHEARIELSRLIDIINDRFGTDFTPAMSCSSIRFARRPWPTRTCDEAATANTMDNFRYVFDKALEGLFIDRMEQMRRSPRSS